jgi:hypothetical protein
MSIPGDHARWAKDDAKTRVAAKLAATLVDQRTDDELFRISAALVDAVNVGSVDNWKWQAPTPEFLVLTKERGVPKLGERAESLRRLK